MKNKYLYLTAIYDPLDEDCNYYVYKLKVFKTDNNHYYAKTVFRKNKYSDYTFCITKKGLHIENDFPLFPILIIWEDYKEYWYNVFITNRKFFYKKMLINPDMWNDFIEYMVYHSEKDAFIKFAHKLGFVGVNICK